MTRRPASLAIAGVLACAMLAGAAPAQAKTATRTFERCESVDVPVIDRGSVGFGPAIQLPKNAARHQAGVVVSVSAAVRIDHTSDSDLVLSLVNPAGRAIALAAARGASGDGYGSGAASCAGTPVTFGDLAPTPISTPGNTGDNPIEGFFRPEQPLSTFSGGPAAGAWMLLMTDRSVLDTGAIRAFDLAVTYRYKLKPKKK